MYGKIKALNNLGIKIHLHYFDYNGRADEGGLVNYCETIHSYKRRTGFSGLSFKIPYIVSSRINDELISNLNKDSYPIILEGIHCTGVLDFINTSHRKILIRLHNDEAAYYKNLFKHEKNLLKKIYFLNESRLLKK